MFGDEKYYIMGSLWKRAESSEDKNGSGSKGEKQQADYEVSKLPGAKKKKKKGESNQG